MVTCRGCGKEIRFEKNERGKFVPLEQDGTNHFETCPQAEKFRKKSY